MFPSLCSPFAHSFDLIYVTIQMSFEHCLVEMRCTPSKLWDLLVDHPVKLAEVSARNSSYILNTNGFQRALNVFLRSQP